MVVRIQLVGAFLTESVKYWPHRFLLPSYKFFFKHLLYINQWISSFRLSFANWEKMLFLKPVTMMGGNQSNVPFFLFGNGKYKYNNGNVKKFVEIFSRMLKVKTQELKVGHLRDFWIIRKNCVVILWPLEHIIRYSVPFYTYFDNIHH